MKYSQSSTPLPTTHLFDAEADAAVDVLVLAQRQQALEVRVELHAQVSLVLLAGALRLQSLT